jgi:hypothetical protein
VGNQSYDVCLLLVESKEWTVTSQLTNYLETCRFSSLSMSSVMSTLKHAFDNALDSAKIKDLAADTVQVTSSSGLTTDHGVMVSDTDNWYVVSAYPNLVLMLPQVEGCRRYPRGALFARGSNLERENPPL